MTTLHKPRWILISAAGVLALVAVTVTLLLHEPAVGATRVDDTQAGIAYDLPPGWVESDPSGFGDAVSSAAEVDSAGAHGVLILGRGSALDQVALDDDPDHAARQLAGYYALMFFGPFAETAADGSATTTIDGNPASTASLRVTLDGEPPAFLVVTVLPLDGDVSFVVTGGDESLRADAENIHGSVSTVG